MIFLFFGEKGERGRGWEEGNVKEGFLGPVGYKQVRGKPDGGGGRRNRGRVFLGYGREGIIY